MRRVLVTVLAVLTTLGLPVLPANAVSPEACTYVQVAGLGLVCPKPGGYELFIDQGTGLRVHGHDTASLPAAEPTAVNATASDPTCTTGDYAIQLIYARPSDRVSQATTRLPQIRALMRGVNGRLEEEAAEFGVSRTYRVRCDGAGVMDVKDTVLPTSSVTDSFDTVAADLRAQGYNSNRIKYAVWYEGGIGSGILGTGHVYYDDSNSVNNNNNGSAGSTSMFAVLWGDEAGVPQYESTTWMHENGHNMGAVQLTSPNSSGAAHCTDGRDVMCYFDGGPKSALYTTSRCTDREHFDCRHDDYFHPSPTSGYLTTNWNVGSTINRFLATATSTVAFTASTAAVNENAGSVSVSVTRTGQTSSAVGVSYATANGSATAGSDYTATSGVLDFAAGVTTRSINIPVANDGLTEGDETLTVGLSTPTGGASLGSPASMTITISDPPSPPTLRFDVSALTASEASSGVTATVVRAGDTSGSASVAYATADATALAGTDYQAAAGTLTFNPGVSSATITVPFIDDQRFEGDESFALTLSAPSGATLTTPNSMTVTILENDLRPSLGMSSAGATIGEAAGSIAVTVTRAGARDDAVGIRLTTIAGTATPGQDYVSADTLLAFAPGVLTRTVPITIVDDAIVEATESFTVALSDPTGGAVIGTPSSQVVQLLDDDGGVVRLASSSYSGSEAPPVTFTATRTMTTSSASVSWALSKITPSGTADVGTLAFAPGVASASVTLNLDDTVWTGTRTLVFSLSNPNAVVLGSPASTTITLTDDEPSAVVGFASASSTFEENAGTVPVTVTRTGSTSSSMTATLTATNGSATLGSDASVATGTITIPSGATSTTVGVSIVNDVAPENAEAFTLVLSAPSSNAVLGQATHSLSIGVSDQQPDVMVQAWPFVTTVGNDSYGGTQETTGLAPRGWNGTATVRIQNDGNVRIPVRITATESGAPEPLRYLYGGADVTETIKGAGLVIWLEPTDITQITVECIPALTSIPGAQRRATIAATWTGDGAHSDAATASFVII